MMEFLDLSVPVGCSGKFIQLHQNGALRKVQPLWTKYCRLQKHLDSVKANLRMCNQPASLFNFGEKCRRQDKDFEKQLRLLVDSLENSKVFLERQIGEICSKLAEVDPSLSGITHTLVYPQMLYADGTSFRSKKSSIAVLGRNMVMEKYPQLGSSDLCKCFDLAEISVPEEWTNEFPSINSWVKAYENPNLRKRIHKMISVAKRDLLLP